MAVNTVQGGNPVESIHGFDGGASGGIIQSAVLVKEGTDTPIQSHTTRGLRVDPAGQGLVTGRSTIATAGSPVLLNNGVSVPGKAVMVVALPTNTQQVAIGDANVNAASASLQGIPLQPGQGQALDIYDVNAIYLDVLGDGHGVTWTVLN